MNELVVEMEVLAELTPHLEILDRVINFEKKVEYSRFLLFIALAGFIGIIGGFIEYICYRFLGVDATFFIFGVTGNPDLAPTAEPILFFSLWLLYLIPILGAGIFTLGTPGIINWNKTYRIIGLIAIGLFILTHFLVVLVGIPNSKLIPIIWGLAISCGFLLTSYFLTSETKSKIIQLGLSIFGIIALILGIFSSIIFPLELAMFLFCLIFGLLLIITSIIAYMNIGRLDGIIVREE
ncbi:MAG: hypothetical protein ACFE95_08525 [Candidatus Hodarchaeota archaeon]